MLFWSFRTLRGEKTRSCIPRKVKNGDLIQSIKNQRGYPGGSDGKEPACQFRRHKRCGFNPWLRKIPWRRVWQPTPVFLPGEPHGQRSLAGYTVHGVIESDTANTFTSFTSGIRMALDFSVATLETKSWQINTFKTSRENYFTFEFYT